MSSNRYLEFDSTYRDRTLHANPAQFIMQISQSGQKTRTTALDPISDSSAHKVFWPSTDFNTTGLTGTFKLTAGVGYNSELTTFVITIPTSQSPNQTEGYYVGATLANTTASPDVIRRITKWRYVGTQTTNDLFQVSVDRAFPDTTDNGDAILIDIPTDFTDTSNPQIFIPGGESVDNYYKGYRIYNQTDSITAGSSVSRAISYYDGTTHMASLDTTTAGGGVVTGWGVGDAYVLRKENPSAINTVQASSSVTGIILNAGESSTTDLYKNYFLRLPYQPTAGSATAGETGEMRRIISYNGTTKTAVVSPAFTTAPSTSDPYELLPYTRDSTVPFVYTGSLTSQQQSVCYEIELLNLVLPNRTLESSTGGRVTSHPYLYVELHSMSAASTSNNTTIYSNNPNSSKMLFRAVVDDTPITTVSPFVKIDGDGMVQTVKFKPNDSFKFSVYHTNGDLFTLRSLNTNSSTAADSIDTTGPEAPDPLVQISALFSLKRVQ